MHWLFDWTRALYERHNAVEPDDCGSAAKMAASMGQCSIFLVALFPFLVYGSEPRASLEGVVYALERLVGYYKNNYKQINLDGLYGLRTLEGESRRLSIRSILYINWFRKKKKIKKNRKVGKKWGVLFIYILLSKQIPQFVTTVFVWCWHFCLRRFF